MASPNPPTAPVKLAAGCVGDSCVSLDPWPLHHVRHRGTYIRLCTSCVLKHHPGSFCCLCFAVLDAGAYPAPEADAAAPVIHCSKCPSAVHLSCLPEPDLAPQFVCPSCENQDGFSFFPVEDKRIDLASARVLLAAARLAAGSMNRAVSVMRAEAERKAKEASAARKRTREMLERAIAIGHKERERTKESVVSVPEPPKKKSSMAATEAGTTTTRRVNNREVDKWMRFHQMGPTVDGTVKEEKGQVAAAGTDKGTNLPPLPTQDTLNSRKNSRVIFTGSTSTASLHS